MKSKKWFFGSLKEMLSFYESYRFVVKMSKEDAINSTLETYSDFYDVLINHNPIYYISMWFKKLIGINEK